MEKKQSSVEWLQDCLSIHFTYDQKMQFEGLFQQAKAMHRKEIEDTFFEGAYGGDIISAEQYYNETFGETKN